MVDFETDCIFTVHDPDGFTNNDIRYEIMETGANEGELFSLKVLTIDDKEYIMTYALV